ncbi:hypothetical protein AMEX_G23691 [Astyanax mexicanus]|uniref:Immunoglobulin V-set domain-containing protein n=1 Tax=Astyanax mexicanus TaxID=7994 RepID=A0A8T2KXU6_ASTMX|nr:hypothetical protein AMEX_G23691 [Astyanax mexicanus]
MISAHTGHLGMTTIINCDYNKTSERKALTVFLRREQLLCSYYYQLKSWKNQSCKENIKLIWIPETEDVSFELLNLQINDTGVYTCAVERHAPPPVKCLGIQRTSLHVIEKEEDWTDEGMIFIVAGISFGVLSGILFTTGLHYQCFSRCCLQPPTNGLKTSELSQVEFHISASPHIIPASAHSSKIMHTK